MSVALTGMDRVYSREEFLRWCDSQPRGRFERVDGRIVAMSPERGAHLRLKSAVWLALRRAIGVAGVSCQALPDGATVAAGNSDYEPDAVVNCGAAMADDATMVPNPVVIVEVLSPSTAAVDTGVKLADYFQVASVVHYLVVNATRRVITHHRRTRDRIETRIVVNGDIVLDPPGLTISVEEIYDAD